MNTTKKKLFKLEQKMCAHKDKKRLNPFEVHINRDKQKVLGRKGKNDRGLPGVSRAKAINKRKQSLLQEYKLKNKDNVFLDKRIGEKSTAMSMEDRAIARFTKERVKMHKKSIFNLNDEEVLTHRGQTLEEIEKFDDPRSDDEFSDENNGGKLDKKFVEEAHFGGGMLSKPDSVLARRDLINQLIAESKKRKAEKQKVREETIDLTEKLDSEWKDLLPLMSVSNKANEDTDKNAQVDAYDKAVRELKFEARGNPSEKLKSEEQIVQEEKEKLEKLETDRLARMRGFVSDMINECKHRSADDLDDGFVVETINDDDNSIASDSHDDNDKDNDDDEDESQEGIGPKESNDENTNSDNEKSTDEDTNDDDSEDNFSDLKQSESSSEDEDVQRHVTFASEHVKDTKQTNRLDQVCPKSILRQNNDPTNVRNLSDGNRLEKIKNDLFKRKEIMEKARRELPYTYNAPESFDEFEKLLRNHNSEYQSIIIDRIIKCNHWTLDGKNKEKLSNLFVYLLQHINNCATTDNVNDLIKCFQIFDRSCPYLYDLAHMNPQHAQTCVQEVISEKYDEFVKNTKKYPNANTLVFFKLVSLLFPTSDFRHPVVTPCLIFMSQILFKSHIKNRQDIAKGLFICTLMLEYTILSRRFAPSVINFLRGIVYAATSEEAKQKIRVIPPFKASCNLLVIEEQINIDIDPSGAHMTASDLIYRELDDEFKIKALVTAVNLIGEFKDQLQEVDAVYSIFDPICKLLAINQFDKYPRNISKHLKKLRKELERLQNKKLEYLVLDKKRPKPLRQYEPKIMTIYDGKQHKPMSKERAEREKLLHKYKKEMKGAVREIRRDNAFLAKAQISQQIKSDTERKRKVKEIFSEAAMQQSELKKIKKKK